MKRFNYIIVLLLTLSGMECISGQTTGQKDSVDYYLAQHHYNVGKVALCVSECKSIIDADTYYATDAKVLLALCRERQGYERAAVRLYKKLVNEDKSASGAFHYASMLTRKGKLNMAQEVCQKAIRYDKSMSDAHHLLSTIMATKGYRFEAMMPLYYFLLINDNQEQQKIAYKQLISLWRRSSQTMNLLKKPMAPDPFNDNMNKMINQWTTSDSIASMKGKDQIIELGRKTENLFDYLLSNSEQNLDFWQVMYSDFFVQLSPRNFLMPYIYYISDASHHGEVLEWISGPEGDMFNEFRLWMEAQ